MHPASCTDPALLAGSELASSHSTVSKFSSINRQTVLMTPEWFTFTSVGENAFMIFNDKNDKDNIKPFHDTIFISPSQMRPSCSVVPVDGDDEQ